MYNRQLRSSPSSKVVSYFTVSPRWECLLVFKPSACSPHPCNIHQALALKNDVDTFGTCKERHPVQHRTCNKMRVCRFVDFVAAPSHFISSLHGSFHMHSQRGRWERGKICYLINSKFVPFVSHCLTPLIDILNLILGFHRIPHMALLIANF